MRVLADKIGEALLPVLEDMDKFVGEERKAGRIHLARDQGLIPVKILAEIDVFAEGNRCRTREVAVVMWITTESNDELKYKLSLSMTSGAMPSGALQLSFFSDSAMLPKTALESLVRGQVRSSKTSTRSSKTPSGSSVMTPWVRLARSLTTSVKLSTVFSIQQKGFNHEHAAGCGVVTPTATIIAAPVTKPSHCRGRQS